VIANFLFLRYISAAVTSPVSHHLSSVPPTVAGQIILTQVAKVLQHAANISPRGYETDSVQSETAELLNRLSARPERFDSLPSNTGVVKSLADLKRNPNSDLSEDLDRLFCSLESSRAELARLLNLESAESNRPHQKCLAAIDLTREIYQRYKAKLYKCDLLH